jgi:hypothetical protein
MNPSTLLHFRDIPDYTLRYFRSGRSNACSIYDIIENVYGQIYSSYPYTVQSGLAPPDPAHNSGVTYGDLLEAKRRVAKHHGRTLEQFLADENIPFLPPISLATVLPSTASAMAMAMDVDSPMPERTVGLHHAMADDARTVSLHHHALLPPMTDEEELAEAEAEANRWVPKNDWPSPPFNPEDDYPMFQYRAGQLVYERGFPSFQAFWSTIREGDTIIYTDTDGTKYHYIYNFVHRSDNNGNCVYTHNYGGVEDNHLSMNF